MRTAKTLIRMGGCPGWSESLLGAHAILLVLSWSGSFYSCALLIFTTSDGWMDVFIFNKIKQLDRQPFFAQSDFFFFFFFFLTCNNPAFVGLSCCRGLTSLEHFRPSFQFVGQTVMYAVLFLLFYCWWLWWLLCKISIKGKSMIFKEMQFSRKDRPTLRFRDKHYG